MVLSTLFGIGCDTRPLVQTEFSLQLPADLSNDSALEVTIRVDGKDADIPPYAGTTRVLLLSVPVGSTVELDINYLTVNAQGFNAYAYSQEFVAETDAAVRDITLTPSSSRDIQVLAGFNDAAQTEFDVDVALELLITDRRSGLSARFPTRRDLQIPINREFDISGENPYTQEAATPVPIGPESTERNVFVALGGIPTAPTTEDAEATPSQNGQGFSGNGFVGTPGYNLECAMGTACDDTLEYMPCEDMTVTGTIEQRYAISVRYTVLTNACSNFSFLFDITPPVVTATTSPTTTGASTTTSVGVRLRTTDPDDLLNPSSIRVTLGNDETNLCPAPVFLDDIWYCNNVVADPTALTPGPYVFDVAGSDLAGNSFSTSARLQVTKATPGRSVFVSGVELYHPNIPAGAGLAYLNIAWSNTSDSTSCDVEIANVRFSGFEGADTVINETWGTTTRAAETGSAWVEFSNNDLLNTTQPTVEFQFGWRCPSLVGPDFSYETLTLDLPVRNYPIKWLGKPDLVIPSFDPDELLRKRLPLKGGRYLAEGQGILFAATDETVISTPNPGSFESTAFDPSTPTTLLRVSDAFTNDTTAATVVQSPSIIAWSDAAIWDIPENGPRTELGQPATSLGLPTALLWEPARDLVIAVGSQGWQSFDDGSNAPSYPVPCGGSNILDAQIAGIVRGEALPNLALLVSMGNGSRRHCEVNPSDNTVIHNLPFLASDICLLPEKFTSNRLASVFTAYGTDSLGAGCIIEYEVGTSALTRLRNASGGGGSPESVHEDPYSRFSVSVNSIDNIFFTRAWTTGDALRSLDASPPSARLGIFFGHASMDTFAVDTNTRGTPSLSISKWAPTDRLNSSTSNSFFNYDYYSSTGSAQTFTAATYHEANKRLYVATVLNDTNKTVAIFSHRVTPYSMAAPTHFATLANSAVHHMIVRGPQPVGLSRRFVAPGDLVTISAQGLAGQGLDSVIVNGLPAQTLASASTPTEVSFFVPEPLSGLDMRETMEVRVRSRGRLSGVLRATGYPSEIEPSPVQGSLNVGILGSTDGCSWNTQTDCNNGRVALIAGLPVFALDGAVGFGSDPKFSLWATRLSTSRFGRWLLASDGGQLLSFPGDAARNGLYSDTQEQHLVSLGLDIKAGELGGAIAHDKRERLSAIAVGTSSGTVVRFLSTTTMTPAQLPDVFITALPDVEDMIFTSHGDGIVLAAANATLSFAPTGMSNDTLLPVLNTGNCPTENVKLLSLSVAGPADHMTMISANAAGVGVWTLVPGVSTIEQSCLGFITTQGSPAELPISAAVSPSGHYVVVGTGSSQVDLLTLFTRAPNPMSIDAYVLTGPPLRVAIAEGRYQEAMVVLVDGDRAETFGIDAVPRVNLGGYAD